MVEVSVREALAEEMARVEEEIAATMARREQISQLIDLEAEASKSMARRGWAVVSGGKARSNTPKDNVPSGLWQDSLP